MGLVCASLMGLLLICDCIQYGCDGIDLLRHACVCVLVFLHPSYLLCHAWKGHTAGCLYTPVVSVVPLWMSEIGSNHQRDPRSKIYTRYVVGRALLFFVPSNTYCVGGGCLCTLLTCRCPVCVSQ